jgi:chemotaxis protein CheX
MALPTKMLNRLNTTEDLLLEKFKLDIRRIFVAMLGLEVLPRPSMQMNRAIDFKHYITSLVGMRGEFSGRVSLHMASESAIKTTKIMLGTDMVSEDDIGDAIGEITNIIAGSIKSHLSHRCYIQLSTPSVVYGNQYINLENDHHKVSACFVIDEAWFVVEVAFETKSAKGESHE